MHSICLLAALAVADDQTQFDTGNWYLTGGLYMETVDYELTFAGGNRDSLEFEDAVSFRLGVGKSISDDWNIEFEFGFGDSNWDGIFLYTDGSSDQVRLEYEYFQASALMCYQMDVSDTFTVVPKFGLGFTNGDFTLTDSFGSASVSESELTIKFGIHAEFELSETADLFAGYRHEFTDFGSGDEFTSTGLIFGAKFSF